MVSSDKTGDSAHKLNYSKSHLNVISFLTIKDGQIMKQDVQKGFGVSIPGDIRNSTGMLAPVNPNLNRGRWTGTDGQN